MLSSCRKSEPSGSLRRTSGTSTPIPVPPRWTCRTAPTATVGRLQELCLLQQRRALLLIDEGDRASVGWTGSFERLGPSRDGLSGRRHLASRQPDGTAHVVNDVGEANLHRRPREANGPNHETHRSLLMGEDVLNGGADL